MIDQKSFYLDRKKFSIVPTSSVVKLPLFSAVIHSSSSILFLTPKMTELTLEELKAYLCAKLAGDYPHSSANTLKGMALTKSI